MCAFLSDQTRNEKIPCQNKSKTNTCGHLCDLVVLADSWYEHSQPCGPTQSNLRERCLYTYNHIAWNLLQRSHNSQGTAAGVLSKRVSRKVLKLDEPIDFFKNETKLTARSPPRGERASPTPHTGVGVHSTSGPTYHTDATAPLRERGVTTNEQVNTHRPSGGGEAPRP